MDKYPETVGILSRIRAFGEAAEVRFAVDALQLESWQRKWDVVAWNHPHLGTEDLKLHGCLLAHFLDGAAKSLRPNGVVVLALLEGQERRWQLLKHAQAQRFDLAESPFELTAFAGYECKRNSTGKSFQSLHVQKTARAAVRSRLYHLRWNVAGQGDVAAFDAMEAALSCKPARLESTQALECAECGKAFSSAQGLKTHVRQVHELLKYADRSESLKCESCGRAFRDSEALTQHRLAAHSSSGRTRSKSRGRSHGFGLGFRTCEICGMSMPLGSSAAAHLEALRPFVDLPLSCACGRSFNERRALEQHQRFCSKATASAKPIFTMTIMVSLLGKLCPCCDIQEKGSWQQRPRLMLAEEPLARIHQPQGNREMLCELSHEVWRLCSAARCPSWRLVEAQSPARQACCLHRAVSEISRQFMTMSTFFERGRLCWTLPKPSQSARPAVGWTGATPRDFGSGHYFTDTRQKTQERPLTVVINPVPSTKAP